jgi:hypothetical protein
MPCLHFAQRRFSSVVGLIPNLIILIYCLATTVSAVPYCSLSGFAPPRTYDPPNSNAFSVTTGDFNGDGRPDVAAGASAPGGIAVLINNGEGGFGAPTIYPIFASHTDITTGDFNNDGKLDIVAVNNNDPGTVTVLLGTGTGSFGAPILSLSGGKGPYYLDKGDFNNDGKLDLAVSNTFDTAGPERNIAILLGDGTGSFTVGSTSLPTEFLRAGDLNLDGKMDVLAVGNPLLTIRPGNGLGGLGAPIPINPSSALDFTIADLNHDNNPDIAAINNSSVLVYLGNGNGTFTVPDSYFVGAHSGSFVENGDVNGDGHLDLVVTKWASTIPGRVFVLRGTGTGTFSAPTTHLLDIQQQPFRLALADFNGDGRADIVTQNLGSPHVSVLLSTCLTPTPRYDFEGDGKSDIGVYRPSSGVWYALRSSDNSFLAQQWGLSTDRIVPADYDADSKTDLAVYRPSSGTWFILRSTNNTFIAQAFGTSTDVPVPVDYDADGRTDLAVYRAGAWYIQRSSDNAVISQSFGTATDKPMPADYDGDGNTDIAVFRPADGTWYMQQSTNGLFRAQPFGTSNDIPLTGDFDGDGKADVAVYRPASGTWYALKSSNSSLLAQRWGVETDIPVAADYDGDGKTDLAVFRPSNGTWYIVRSSDGAFVSQQFGLSTDVPVHAGYVLP